VPSRYPREETLLPLRNRAIVVDLEPGCPVARQPRTCMRVAEHRMIQRPTAGVGISETQPG
jgi:hypothetical protein